MKIKIIKKYEWPDRPGRFWNPEQVADVTNEKGNQMIKDGFAHEVRWEKRKDGKGLEYEVQVEILDKKGTTITKKINEKQ